MNSTLLFPFLSAAVLVGTAMLFHRLGMPENLFVHLFTAKKRITRRIFLLRRDKSFRLLRLCGNKVLIVSFFLFGITLGLASALLWPRDLGVYINILGTAAGDWVYRTAIAWIGNPYSGQAHFTIPWLLRIPQVYAWITPVIYAVIGLAVQYLYYRIRKWDR